MGLGVVGLALGLAWAQEAPGLPVAQVALEAVVGELPAEDLLPLLQAQQGAALHEELLASDLAVLESTGMFEEVEARTEPWFVLDEAGEPVRSVRVVYLVRTAPTLRRLSLVGAEGRRRRQLLAAAGLSRGDRVSQREQEAAGFRVLRACAELGLEGSELQVRATPLDDGRVDLELQLEPGVQVRVRELSFAGDLGLPASTLRRVAGGAGVEEGGVFLPESPAAAERALEDALVEAGYLSARVRYLLEEEPGPERDVGFVVAAGPRVEVRVEGLSHLHRRGVTQALRLDSEARLDRVDLEVLGERAALAVRQLGYADPRVVVEEATSSEDGVLSLRVRVEAGERYRLGRLEFEGASFHAPAFLEAAAVEASPQVLGRGRVSVEAMAEVNRALERTYRSDGYLDARLELVALEPRGRRMDVLVGVDEGVRTELIEVVIVGGEADLVRPYLEQAASLVGGPYRSRELRELADAVARAHREAGFAEARSDLEVALEGGLACVQVRVESGGRLVLRNVIVVGSERTRLSVVHRELPLDTGQALTPSELDGVRRGLYDLGSFRTVDLRVSEGDGAARDLLVLVEEQPTWSTQLSAGLATDEGLRTYGRVTRRHLFGLAHRLSLVGQVGLGYQGDSWRLDTTAPEWRAGLRYEAPRTPASTQMTWLELLANERNQEPTYRLSRSGAAIGLESEVGDLRVVASYGLQWRRLEDVDAGALVVGDPWRELGDDPTQLGTRRQGSLGVQALVDQRDDAFDPQRGRLTALEVVFADPVLTRSTWLRGELRVQQWVGLGPLTGLLEVQAGLGLVPGLGTTLPLEERFRLGGAGSLRGYPLDHVGPKMRVADQDLDWPSALDPVVDHASRQDPQRWVPTGGDAMALATAELHAPMSLLGFRRWTSAATVAFVDVGNTWFVDPAVFATSEVVEPEPLLRYGLGLGLRQSSPVGPVQVDVAVNPLYYTTTWAAERGEVPLRLHLTLGSL